MYTYIHNSRHNSYTKRSGFSVSSFGRAQRQSDELRTGLPMFCYISWETQTFNRTQTDFCFSSQLYDSFLQLLWNLVQHVIIIEVRGAGISESCWRLNIYIHIFLLYCDVAYCNCFWIGIAFCTYTPPGVHYPGFVYYSLVFEWHIWNVRRSKVTGLGCFRAHRLPLLLTTVTTCGSSSTMCVCDRRSG